MENDWTQTEYRAAGGHWEGLRHSGGTTVGEQMGIIMEGDRVSLVSAMATQHTGAAALL